MKQLVATSSSEVRPWNLGVKHLWGITGLIWAVIAVFHYLQFYLQHLNSGNNFLWLATLAEFIVNYSSWIPIALFIIWLAKRYRFQKDGWQKPLLVHFFASIIIGSAHIAIVAAMLQATKGAQMGYADFSEYFVFCFLWLFHFEFLMYWVVLGLSYGFEYYSVQRSGRPQKTIYLNRLVIKNNGQTFLLNTAKIDWLEAADNYVRVHSGGQSHLIRERMHVLENKLDPQLFKRIHRSAIVNMSCIKALQHGKKGDWTLCLRDGQQLQVSRRRKEQLQQYLEQIS